MIKFFHVGNNLNEYNLFERVFYRIFQIITIITLITLAVSQKKMWHLETLQFQISKDFRVKAEKEILRIKTSACIEALHLSLKMDVVPDQTPFYRSQVNNVLVIDKFTGKTFSTYINLNKLKLLKNTAKKEGTKKRVRFPSIEDIPPDFLKSAERIDFSPNQDTTFIHELENIKDNESIIQKFKRCLFCLDWKTHLYPANPKYYIVPRKLSV